MLPVRFWTITKFRNYVIVSVPRLTFCRWSPFCAVSVT